MTQPELKQTQRNTSRGCLLPALEFLSLTVRDLLFSFSNAVIKSQRPFIYNERCCCGEAWELQLWSKMEVQASVGLLMDHKVIAREFPPTLVGHKWGDPKNTPPLKISPNKQLLGSKDSDTLQCLLWTVEWTDHSLGQCWSQCFWENWPVILETSEVIMVRSHYVLQTLITPSGRLMKSLCS